MGVVMVVLVVASVDLIWRVVGRSSLGGSGR